MNKTAELPFPHMIWFSCFCGISWAQVFTVTVSVSLRFYAGVQLFVVMFWTLVSSVVASYMHVFIVFTLGFFPKVALLGERRKIYRKNEHADSSKSVNQSVLGSQRVKNQSLSRKISTNYEQPRQSAVESQRTESCWKSRAASNSSCIFLERDPCLRRATKIVATEVGRVRQTVTPCFHTPPRCL
jgi:hypothetical protein